MTERSGACCEISLCCHVRRNVGPTFMFTGIVEEAGAVEQIKPTAKSIQLTVRARICGRGLKVGDSLAVNGCCLTAVKANSRVAHRLVRFDLLQETWQRTNLQFAR